MRHEGVIVDVFGSHPRVKDADLYQSLSKIRPDSYDIINTHACNFSPAFIAMALKRKAGQRHIHTLHGVSVDYLRACGAWLNWRCYTASVIECVMSHHGDHVIAVSESVKRAAQKYFALPGEKITVIYNGFEPQLDSSTSGEGTREKLGLAADDTAVLFVGRGNDRVKGTQAISDAMDKLHCRYPGLKLIAIPGDGFANRQWLIKAGNIGHKTIGSYYKAANIFVSASLNEGMPLTVIEAMHTPLPIIASRVGGIPEIITHNHSGLLMDSADSDLAKLIEYLILNPQQCQKLAGNAQKAAKVLTWSTAAKKTIKTYESMIMKKKR